jgi:signal peptidase I
MIKDPRAMAARKDAENESQDGIWETIKVILQALVIAIFVRTFFFQPFNIPSSSMYPTLKIGDYLFVSKLSYGYGKYSFNFALGGSGDPIVKCCSFVDFPGRKVLADTPKRGDVAVFKLPSNTEIDYIKRVIGLPGDRIQMREGVLYINDVMVPKKRIEDYVDDGNEASGDRDLVSLGQYEETLPNGVTYRVLDIINDNVADNTEVYQVPDNHYFMMGDNRDNSTDSRFASGVGFVPIENFVGRADIIFFSIAPGARIWEVWKWPLYLRLSRFLNLL